ncbi:MAG: nucleotidyltransferase family protein [Nitrososphaerota archaeon]|nr:nucleotidyltransferase family protein [Nitrososphaerota archaeon]
MKCLILAGGLGKRLRPLTENKPKTMIRILGVPIIGWELSWLARNGIRDAVVSTGYMKERIIEYLKDGDDFNVHIEYCIEEEPLGTGGGLKKAARFFHGEDRFIMLYGDILTDLNPLHLSELLKTAQSSTRALGAMAIIPLRSPFGIVELKGEDMATGFREKPILNDRWMNAGVYCLSTQIFSRLPDKGSFESQVLSELAKRKELLVKKYDQGRWRSIDSVKDIEEAEIEFSDSVPELLENQSFISA